MSKRKRRQVFDKAKRQDSFTTTVDGVETTMHRLLYDSKKDIVLKELENNYGIVTETCKASGISTPTFYKWLKEYPDFMEKCNEIINGQFGFVEKKLFENIKANKEKSIIFYLERKGKDKGYSKLVETRERKDQPLLEDFEGLSEEVEQD